MTEESAIKICSVCGGYQWYPPDEPPALWCSCPIFKNNKPWKPEDEED